MAWGGVEDLPTVALIQEGPSGCNKEGERACSTGGEQPSFRAAEKQAPSPAGRPQPCLSGDVPPPGLTQPRCTRPFGALSPPYGMSHFL